MIHYPRIQEISGVVDRYLTTEVLASITAPGCDPRDIIETYKVYDVNFHDFAIMDAGEFLGCISFTFMSQSTNLAFWLRPEARGRGLIQQSYHRLVAHHECLGRVFTAETAPTNTRARKTLERLGFSRYEQNDEADHGVLGYIKVEPGRGDQSS